MTRLASSNVETLRWRDGKLEMIDQRVLPAVFEYIAYDSAESVAEGMVTEVAAAGAVLPVSAVAGITTDPCFPLGRKHADQCADPSLQHPVLDGHGRYVATWSNWGFRKSAVVGGQKFTGSTEPKAASQHGLLIRPLLSAFQPVNVLGDSPLGRRSRRVRPDAGTAHVLHITTTRVNFSK